MDSSQSQEEPQNFAKPIRAVTKLNPVDHYLASSWEALGNGAPVLVALAQLSAEAVVHPCDVDLEKLQPEAKAILYAARDRGVIEIKGSHIAFEAPARLLAVYIEVDDTQTLTFRDPEKPEVTVRFLEGFRELCSKGLAMHHIHRDFSLTARGFEIARAIERKEVQAWLAQGREFGLHE
jgi:hypothetical protein